jgi:ATP-dependent helicase HepA
MAWFRILNDGLGVFDRSISSLQYLVEEEIGAVARSLVQEGPKGFDAPCTSLGRLLGRSGAGVTSHQPARCPDQLSPVPEQELDDLFDADADWRGIREQ